LGVPLEVDEAEAVRADGEMHSGFGAFDQDVQSGRLELVAPDFVEARVRHIEPRVHVGNQRMAAVQRVVTVDAPALGWQWPTLLVVTELQHSMGGKAGT